MKFDWVTLGRLGWFVGPLFLLCDGLSWVEELDPRTTLQVIIHKPPN